MNNTRYELKLILTQIHELNTRLSELMKDSSYLSGCVSILPPVLPEDTEEPIESIKVTNVTAEDKALSLVCSAYNKFYAEQNSSMKSTYRLPGAINLCNNHAEQITYLVKEINTHKDMFRHLVTTKITDVNLRFELIHDTFPLLITLQVYRKINLINGPVMSVRPFWGNKQSIVRVTKEQILERLERSKKFPPNEVFKEEWAEIVERERIDVAALPENAILRIRRPVKVQPLAWVRGIDKKMTSIANPLPVLVLSDKPVVIGQLKDFDLHNIKHKNPPKIKSRQLIVERLHLYQELE